MLVIGLFSVRYYRGRLRATCDLQRIVIIVTILSAIWIFCESFRGIEQLALNTLGDGMDAAWAYIFAFPLIFVLTATTIGGAYYYAALIGRRIAKRIIANTLENLH
jgi:hypothetical protein